MEEKVFFDCDCCAHGIRAQFEKLESDDGKILDAELNLSFYEYGQSTGASWGWGHRLKHIWNIIRKGQTYTDMILLSPDKARKLADFITKNLDGYESRARNENKTDK